MARITALLKSLGANRSAQHVVQQQTASRFIRSRLSRTLKFEPLEDRRMLATFTVTSLSDATVTGPGNAPGTLRQAIYDANISSDSDIIDFALGVSGDLRLSIAEDSAIGLSALLVTSPITIQGNAAGITIKRDITAPIMRFFRVAPGGDLTLDSINVTSGITVGVNGASGQNGGAAFGGAIYNQGSVEIVASTIYNNTAMGGSAGAGANPGAGQGGAVFNDGGSVSIRNSTFSGNSVSNGAGTVARSFGGSVYSKNGTLSVYNSTITNGSGGSGRDLYIIGIGAGQTATAQIYSSIIAQADVQSSAYDINATYDLDGQLNVTGANNIIRWQNDYQSIAISSDDPLLGALTNNGGSTLTHALQPDSPAIGHGSNLLNLSNDQRGAAFARTVGGTADIGAFELQTVATPNLPGDYNANQAVDAADYVVWRKTVGTSVTQYTGADGTGDSQIDAADYDVWRGNFGATSPASGATVPTAVNLIATEALVGASTLQSTGSDLLSSRIDVHNNDRIRTVRNTSPVSQQARDEALLIITDERFGARDSEFARASLHSNVESGSAKDDFDRDFLLAAHPLNQVLPQIDPLAAASIGTA